MATAAAIDSVAASRVPESIEADPTPAAIVESHEPTDIKAVFLGGLFALALLAACYAAAEIVLPIVVAVFGAAYYLTEEPYVSTDDAFVRAAKVTVNARVAGQAVECAHYRVSGGAQADLWFDANERLVRQDSIEDGHRTVLELTRLQRE